MRSMTTNLIDIFYKLTIVTNLRRAFLDSSRKISGSENSPMVEPFKYKLEPSNVDRFWVNIKSIYLGN